MQNFGVVLEYIREAWKMGVGGERDRERERGGGRGWRGGGFCVAVLLFLLRETEKKKERRWRGGYITWHKATEMADECF